MSAHHESVVLRTFSLGFVRAYVVTMRPYLMFVSGITGLAGMVVSVENLPIRKANFARPGPIEGFGI